MNGHILRINSQMFAIFGWPLHATQDVTLGVDKSSDTSRQIPGIDEDELARCNAENDNLRRLCIIVVMSSKFVADLISAIGKNCIFDWYCVRLR